MSSYDGYRSPFNVCTADALEDVRHWSWYHWREEFAKTGDPDELTRMLETVTLYNPPDAPDVFWMKTESVGQKFSIFFWTINLLTILVAVIIPVMFLVFA